MTISTTDRRVLIVDSAIDLIAAQGLRALTHRALDTALELPAGSTSYYFRTKRALIEAIVDRIALRSRTDFAAAGGMLPAAGTAGRLAGADPDSAAGEEGEPFGADLHPAAASDAGVTKAGRVWRAVRRRAAGR
ncbi:TetR/AcrR family transcriptional regulator [Nocardia sp. NPDC055321]